MGNEKWGNYTQEFTLGHDAEEIKNVQAILNRPRSCTDFSPAARYAVQRLADYAAQEHEPRSLPDDLPYKDSVRRVLIQAPTVDAVRELTQHENLGEPKEENDG